MNFSIEALRQVGSAAGLAVQRGRRQECARARVQRLILAASTVS
jgi:hypothetical protein